MTAITMLDVIKMGAVKRPVPLPCPWCGEDPPLASQSHGRFYVCCENEDCPAQPAVTAASLTDVWAKWNTRAPIKSKIIDFPAIEIDQQIGGGSK